MTEQELLLTALLNCKRADLYTKNLSLNKTQEAKLSVMLKRRQAGEPIQYITGFTEFMGFSFKTDRRALIPRPETEILVEEALKLIKNNFTDQPRILDLGTGSGNIAISLSKYLPKAMIFASDISREALEIAYENAKINGGDKQISFIESDLFNNGFDDKNNLFDVIISNPPYLTEKELNDSSIEISFEPRIALDGGREGLEFYRNIINDAPKYLRKGGYLIFEIGFNQLKKIKGIVDNRKKFVIEKTIKDYNNIDRVVFLKRIS